jgi:hypothetical protein
VTEGYTATKLGGRVGEEERKKKAKENVKKTKTNIQTQHI